MPLGLLVPVVPMVDAGGRIHPGPGVDGLAVDPHAVDPHAVDPLAVDPLHVKGRVNDPGGTKTISFKTNTVAPSSEAISSRVLNDASISDRVRPMTVPSSSHCQQSPQSSTAGRVADIVVMRLDMKSRHMLTMMKREGVRELHSNVLTR